MTNATNHPNHPSRRDLLIGAAGCAAASIVGSILPGCTSETTPAAPRTASASGNTNETPAMMPTLFLSHGAPSLIIENGKSQDFLRGLGNLFPRPKAIICASAHWNTYDPLVDAAPRPQTLHDFSGFQDELYDMTYDSAGAPDLARRACELLKAAGFQSDLDDRGYDHGSWVPMKLIYPDASIPMFQVALTPESGAKHHFDIGRALAPLRKEGVLIVGSGSATHNIFERPDKPGTPDWVRSFDDWLVEKVASADAEALIDYRKRAPNARRNHPTEEHFFPLLVALGAASEAKEGKILHRELEGWISMGMYRFG